MQGSAVASLRDMELSDRQRAERARDLAGSGAVISARLVEASPGTSQSDTYDLCEFDVQVAGSSS